MMMVVSVVVAVCVGGRGIYGMSVMGGRWIGSRSFGRMMDGGASDDRDGCGFKCRSGCIFVIIISIISSRDGGTVI